MNEMTSSQLIENMRHVSLLALSAIEADTLEDVLQKITDAARELIGSKYAALGVPNRKGGLRFFTVSGISEEHIRQIAHHPVGVGLIGEIMRTRTPLRLSHMSDHPHAAGFPPGHPPMYSLLGMPIQIGDQLFGSFYLTDTLDGEDFTDEDEAMLEMLANSAALAIAGAKFREQQQQLTLLQERERIAMDLHDTTIQSLYALGLGLDLASRTGTIQMDVISEALQHINQMIEEIRGYILKLNTGDSVPRSLRQELSQSIGDLFFPRELQVEINAPEIPSKLSSNVIAGVRSMVHECVSNVIRHANADHVTIQADENKTALFVSISDNGVGFDVHRLDVDRGLGLQNIQKRIRLYGGTFEVESNNGQGTRVMLTVPMLQPH